MFLRTNIEALNRNCINAKILTKSKTYPISSSLDQYYNLDDQNYDTGDSSTIHNDDKASTDSVSNSLVWDPSDLDLIDINTNVDNKKLLDRINDKETLQGQIKRTVLNESLKRLSENSWLLTSDDLNETTNRRDRKINKENYYKYCFKVFRTVIAFISCLITILLIFNRFSEI